MITKEAVDRLVDHLNHIQVQDKPIFLFNLWERSKTDPAMLQLAIYAVFLNSYHPQYSECDWIGCFDGQINPKINQLYRDEIAEVIRQKSPLQAKLFQILTSQSLSKKDKQIELVKQAIDEDLGISKWIDYRILDIRDQSKDDIIREVITSDAIITHVENQSKARWLIDEMLVVKENLGNHVSKFINRLGNHRLFKPAWVTMIRFLNQIDIVYPQIYQLFTSDLKVEIHQIKQQISFEDFRNFIEILLRQYEGTGKASGKKRKFDNADRIQRRVDFWGNYKNKFKNTLFILSSADYQACSPYLKLGMINELSNVIEIDQIPCPILYFEMNHLGFLVHLTISNLKTYLIDLKETQNQIKSIIHQKGEFRSILQILESQRGYKLDYCWQILFSLLLAKEGIDIDQPSLGFNLGFGPTQKYHAGKGIDFDPKRIKDQNCSLMQYWRTQLNQN
jgi:hypothetical protein